MSDTEANAEPSDCCITYSTSPDETFALLTGLAHTAVDMSFATVAQPAQQVEAPAGQQELREALWRACVEAGLSVSKRRQILEAFCAALSRSEAPAPEGKK